ncbi:hypothetical protein Y032_0114g414 [Ancylostoma ceylanicum]|uniref:WW domain-containing protein n=1 Tax=Ancylostoma ceylanicum TaxID=53326 RepID=A0A016TCA0_9BILA|nr:hypothetical protein Y032_0114g414 [Ancylostoma ceylanicum]
MGTERRKKHIEIDGLPEPWLAYVHMVKKRVFYHNPDTNQSFWELPKKVKKKCTVDTHELEEKLQKILSSEESDDIEMMDCTEWQEPAGSPEDACEAMDIDFTEDLRQVRGSEYDKEALSVNSEGHQPFADLNGSSRSCVVLDTCALIDEPDLIHSCISKNVTVVIPYRVFYELDRMKKLSSTSDSATELRRIATRIVWILRDLRESPLIYWESSTESFSPVEGFMTSSEEDVNDDFILKCAYRMKALLDARNDGWETVLLTNDQVLSLKAHASRIPCYNVKEAKAILAKAPTPVASEKKQLEEPCTAASGSSTSVSKSPGRVVVEKRCEAKARTKEIDDVVLRSAHCLSKVHKKKKDDQKHNSPEKLKEMDNDATDPLKRFEQMWKPLVKVLEKNFVRNQNEESLQLLVQMTWWLYYYYYPPPRNVEQKDSYKIRTIHRNCVRQTLATICGRFSTKIGQRGAYCRGHHDPNVCSSRNCYAAATQTNRKAAAWRPCRTSPVMAQCRNLARESRGDSCNCERLNRDDHENTS